MRLLGVLACACGSKVVEPGPRQCTSRPIPAADRDDRVPGKTNQLLSVDVQPAGSVGWRVSFANPRDESRAQQKNNRPYSPCIVEKTFPKVTKGTIFK
jgi:hypothetical protein